MRKFHRREFNYQQIIVKFRLKFFFMALSFWNLLEMYTTWQYGVTLGKGQGYIFLPSLATYPDWWHSLVTVTMKLGNQLCFVF